MMEGPSGKAVEVGMEPSDKSAHGQETAVKHVFAGGVETANNDAALVEYKDLVVEHQKKGIPCVHRQVSQHAVEEVPSAVYGFRAGGY
jgi:hypothetical protein